MRQNFIGQFAPLLRHWLCNVWMGIVIENWFLSVDQCLLQALQFSVHLIDLLSILLMVLSRFRRLWWRWAPDCQTVTMMSLRRSLYRMRIFIVTYYRLAFFWVHVWLWEVLWSFFLVQPLNWLLLVVL